MKSVSSRIWTPVAVSISYDDKHYTTGISKGFTTFSKIKCCIAITIMIPITKVIQYILKYKTQVDSVVSDTNNFLISWLRSMATRRERHNSYYANPTHNVQHISWCLRSLSVEIYKTWPHASNVEDPTLCLNGPISTDSLFKILKFSWPSLPGMTSFHTPAPFTVWGFIMTMVTVISFARERKTAPNV